MSKSNKDSFGFLGYEFQVKLIAQLLTDNKFAQAIMDIVSPNYFDSEYMRKIMATLKDAYDTDEVVLDMGSLRIRLFGSINDEVRREFIITVLEEISNASLNDTFDTQKKAIQFCKQQALKVSLVKIQKIIEKGDLDDYDECEQILKEALEVGNPKDDGMDIFDDIEDVLKEDFRQPIPTGIGGMDEVMGGGLARCELGVILAPFGVGKTTMITKLANHAKNEGYNVLQIFFEDNPKVIQRKHISCWTGIELNELSENKESIIEEVNKRKAQKGIIKLKKFSSDGTTMPKIKQYIRKLIAHGFRPDMVLLDYIDCVESTKQYKDAWGGEGPVMRQFESMLDELNMAGWTAVQGNRSSIGAEVVEAGQIGGSIKKGQIGHFIVSIAKTLPQKEDGTANMAILKSRFGKDGIVFRDIIFNNGTVTIDMTEESSGRTFLEDKADKKKEDADSTQNLINVALEKIQKQRELIEAGKNES